jgi:hypothetical protein
VTEYLWPESGSGTSSTPWILSSKSGRSRRQWARSDAPRKLEGVEAAGSCVPGWRAARCDSGAGARREGPGRSPGSGPGPGPGVKWRAAAEARRCVTRQEHSASLRGVLLEPSSGRVSRGLAGSPDRDWPGGTGGPSRVFPSRVCTQAASWHRRWGPEPNVRLELAGCFKLGGRAGTLWQLDGIREALPGSAARPGDSCIFVSIRADSCTNQHECARMKSLQIPWPTENRVSNVHE